MACLPANSPLWNDVMGVSLLADLNDCLGSYTMWGERVAPAGHVELLGGGSMSTKVELHYHADAMCHSLVFSTTIMISREALEELEPGHPFRTDGPTGIVNRLSDDGESLPNRLRLLANLYETMYSCCNKVPTVGAAVAMAMRTGTTPAEFVRRWHEQAIEELPPPKPHLRALDLGGD